MSASEASTLQPNTPIPASNSETTSSSIRVLGEGLQEPDSIAVSKSAESSDGEGAAGEKNANGLKLGKRRPLGLGKRTGDEKAKEITVDEITSDEIAGNRTTPIAAPVARRAPLPTSPSRSNHIENVPSSPQRNLYSASPRIVSPARSQIFERDVQESSLPVPNSPAIPSHIQTENHIPSVLDASSEAITNDKLDPDTVEIVMHASHQPAAVSVTGLGSSELNMGTWNEDLGLHTEKDETASGYGALDTADVRRLSFISFSDIVQSEHAEHSHAGGRDSIYVAGLSSLSSAHNRSPSPIRSPVSSQGLGTSPPTSKSASVKGVDFNQVSRPLGSPVLSSHTGVSGGELTIETMSQALRRTGSGDLSGFRSQPLSPSSPDGLSDKSFR